MSMRCKSGHQSETRPQLQSHTHVRIELLDINVETMESPLASTIYGLGHNTVKEHRLPVKVDQYSRYIRGMKMSGQIYIIKASKYITALHGMLWRSWTTNRQAISSDTSVAFRNQGTKSRYIVWWTSWATTLWTWSKHVQLEVILSQSQEKVVTVHDQWNTERDHFSTRCHGILDWGLVPVKKTWRRIFYYLLLWEI